MTDDYATCPLCSWWYHGLHAPEHYGFHMEAHHTGHAQVELRPADRRFLKTIKATWPEDDQP